MDDRNLVTEALIRKCFGDDGLMPNNITKDIVELEANEPRLHTALNILSENFIENFRQQYPVINQNQPRIFTDIFSTNQIMFMSGFRLGKEVMRDMIEEFFEEMLQNKVLDPEDDKTNFQ